MDKILDTYYIQGDDKFNIFLKKEFDTFLEKYDIANEISNRFYNYTIIEMKHLDTLMVANMNKNINRYYE